MARYTCAVTTPMGTPPPCAQLRDRFARLPPAGEPSGQRGQDLSGEDLVGRLGEVDGVAAGVEVGRAVGGPAGFDQGRDVPAPQAGLADLVARAGVALSFGDDRGE